jgi:PBS lyase HEAT-like repeat
MNNVERLIESFSAQSSAPVYRKLDVLLDLEQLRDPQCVPFLLKVLRDRKEPLEVRMRVIRLLRLVRCPGEARTAVGRELSEVLLEHGSSDLRVAAALTLAEFTELSGVASALGSVALDPTEALDLRYSAFTSLERVGPTPDCAALLQQLAHDEALGPSARSLLARWQLA